MHSDRSSFDCCLDLCLSLRRTMFLYVMAASQSVPRPPEYSIFLSVLSHRGVSCLFSFRLLFSLPPAGSPVVFCIPHSPLLSLFSLFTLSCLPSSLSSPRRLFFYVQMRLRSPPPDWPRETAVSSPPPIGTPSPGPFRPIAGRQRLAQWGCLALFFFRFSSFSLSSFPPLHPYYQLLSVASPS